MVVRGVAGTVEKYGGVTQLPPKLVLYCPLQPFASRAEAVLRVLDDPALRAEFVAGYTRRYWPYDTNWEEYEEWVRTELLTHYPGCQSLDETRVNVGGRNGHPDGLLYNPNVNELVIVEAKAKCNDFTDGVGQLVQYFAKARSMPDFSSLRISSCLITARPQEPKDYQDLMSLLRSNQTTRFALSP